MDNSCTTVAVLSRNYSTGLGVIRSLGEAGYTVDLIACVKKKGSSRIAAKSRYVNSTHEISVPDIRGNDGSALVTELLGYAAKQSGKPVLLPTDDYTASVMASCKDALSEHFLMPGVTDAAPHTLTALMDKSVQAHLAQSSGLITPKSWVIDLSEEITIPSELPFPCFVKPLMSIAGLKSEMAACRDEKELKVKLETMKKSDCGRSVLVQEYLDISAEYSLSGLCLDGRVIIPAVIEKTKTAVHERGVAVTGVLRPVSVLGDMEEKLSRLMLGLHYVGMFDIDIDRCGDRLYFNELNLRSGGTGYVYTQSGVNLPAMLVSALCGDAPYDCGGITLGKSFVYEKVAWEEYIYAGMSRRELRRCMTDADLGLMRSDIDRAPFRTFRLRIILSAIKHMLLRLCGLEQQDDIPPPRPDAVITGRNWGNMLCMIRALGRKGLNVSVLRLYKSKPGLLSVLGRIRPEKKSRYAGAYHELIIGDDTDFYAELLIKLAPVAGKPVLIPTDDWSAYLTDAVYDKLCPYYELPDAGGRQGGICRLMDKTVQKELAKSCGLPVLGGCTIVCGDGKPAIPDGIHYPCFIKPAVSMTSTKTALKKCRDGSELLSALEGVSGAVLCEDWASVAEEYSLLGMSRNGHVSAPCIFRTEKGGHRERKGVALSGVTVSDEIPCELIRLCEKLVKDMRYTGLFDIDLIKTDDGAIYFTEINFRAGASVHVFTESGANIPAAYCGRGELHGVKNGVSFVSEKLLLEELARGDISPGTMRRMIKEADVRFVGDTDDPAPYRYMRRFYPAAFLMRLPYKLKK